MTRKHTDAFGNPQPDQTSNQRVAERLKGRSDAKATDDFLRGYREPPPDNQTSNQRVAESAALPLGSRLRLPNASRTVDRFEPVTPEEFASRGSVWRRWRGWLR